LSLTLRLSLVFRETARRIGSRLQVRVGQPIPFAELARFGSREEMMRELRKRTYDLAQAGDIKGDRKNLHLRIGRIKGWKPSTES
jgi:hypothetical protein